MTQLPFSDIYFDCDSTLIRVESLDWLAGRRGIGEEVRQLTELSMSGQVPLEAVFKKKMDMIRPSRALIAEFVANAPQLLVPHAREVIQLLHKLGKRVHILTSNFHPIADPIAELCRIPLDRVIAGDLYFDEAGEYAGMNEQSPMCKNDGKFLTLSGRCQGVRCAMIGDGSTDLACKSAVDLFVGFGGITARQKVKDEAEVFVEEASLMPVLEHLCAEEELIRVRSLLPSVRQ